MMMTVNPYVSTLSLYDLANSPGVAVDLSHINSKCKVNGYKGPKELKEALEGANMVIVSAGLPRKPGMTRDDLFACNAQISVKLASYCADYCPDAMILLITNPINSLIPLYDEVFRRKGIDAGNRLIGLTILDTIRASTFVGEALGISPDFCNVPVVGGHAGTTIIPLLSQLQSGLISEIDVPGITKRIQYAGDEVVVAKEGGGSATLAMAYAAATFTASALRAMDGEKNVIEPGFVRQDFRECKYFSSLLRLGINGVEEPIPLPTRLTSFEKSELSAAIPSLLKQAKRGIDFAKNATL